MMVDGVVHAPGGAHFTSCAPDYGRDEAFQAQYAKAARTPEDWQAFRTAWLDIPEPDYQRKVRELQERAAETAGQADKQGVAP
jgi:glutaconate CoA-transferase subunit A